MCELSDKDIARINFYVGSLDKDVKYNDLYKQHDNNAIYKLLNTPVLKHFLNIESLNETINNMEDNNHKKVYLRPLYDTFIEYDICKNYIFFVTTGDVQHTIKIPSFTKNIINGREINKGVILRCFNFNRHWYNYYNKVLDINFEKKINKIIWRGATTGSENRKGNRFTLVKQWFNKNKNIDVGFSHICQGKNAYECYKKNKMSIKEMLNYKYIISVEGNDKDSGINWKLNSNSLVLMPKPTVSSWLMETTLIPNYHYILLQDDFSDLEEKFIWCENNQDKCKKIINNANKYMEQFKNEKQEKYIEKCVIEKVLNFYN